MDSFCVLPFYSIELGHLGSKNRYCCRLPHDVDIEEIRESIKKNQRHPACNSCWQCEDRGLDSERLMHNRSLDYYLDQDLESIKNDAFNGNAVPRMIKILTSNICNGTCMTCDSKASSAWASLEKKKTILIKTELQTLNNVDWGLVRQLSFVGGEPFLEKTNLDIMQNLVDIGNFDCFISIVTNGSIELNQRQFDMLSKFRNLNICLSIDAVGEKFEYLRYPLQWDLLLENINHFRSFAKHLSVSCTVSNVSVLSLDETIDFFQKNDLKYLCKPVAGPDFFMPGNLPNNVKQKLNQSSMTHAKEVMPFLDMGTYSPEKFSRCWQEITRQDQLKKISIENYLAEFAATKIYDTSRPLQEKQ